jgi:hypothetical protein
MQAEPREKAQLRHSDSPRMHANSKMFLRGVLVAIVSNIRESEVIAQLLIDSLCDLNENLKMRGLPERNCGLKTLIRGVMHSKL